MELAIPLIALGGMYVISNQTNKEGLTKKSNMNTNMPKESFNNMGIRSNLQQRTPESKFSNYLPNTNTPPQNYPIMNNKNLLTLFRNIRILILLPISILIKTHTSKKSVLELLLVTAFNKYIL
jgi:hypothetical protein